MARQATTKSQPAAARRGRSLYAAIWLNEDEEQVRYFTDEAEARAFLAEHAPGDALSAIGAWGDLDWEDFLQWMDRVKQESKPTPPIDELDYD